MMPGYHLLLRGHAAREVLSRQVDIPKPELGVDYAEIKNPIIPPVQLKPQMPVRVKVYDVKTLDDIAYAGKGAIVNQSDFPKEGWLGTDLAGV